VAAVSFDWYHKLFSVEEGGELVGDAFSIDYLSDTIKVALLTSAYTPNLGTHKVFSDLTNEVAAGGRHGGLVHPRDGDHGLGRGRPELGGCLLHRAIRSDLQGHRNRGHVTAALAGDVRR
jgi:hypothetical protein